MRQVVCDDKGCKLEPPSQNMIGGGRVNILSGGGLPPVLESELVPIPSANKHIVKKRRLTGGGVKKKRSVSKKKRSLKKQKRSLIRGIKRLSITKRRLVGGGRKKKIKRKRKCVPKK